jgi:uncharacterized protein (TIGR02145 family)
MINKFKLLFYSLFIMIVLFFAKSCKKEDDENKNPIDTITDIDGNVYHFDTIGAQIWLLENLKVTHYRNGDIIPNVTSNGEWEHLRTDAYCNYKNNDSITLIYGRLYNWYAANDPRNICPKGWHIPSYSEWWVLVNYLGGEFIAGGKMKETGQEHWFMNYKATNESGFTGLPGGYRSYYGGECIDIGQNANWWTSTDKDSIWAPVCTLLWYDASFYRDQVLKTSGFNLRCVKD